MSSIETLKPQTQDRQPGLTEPMQPHPIEIRENYRGSGKLTDRVAVITGGDSGIGRSVALHFATEGADIAVLYLNEDEDARDTKTKVEAIGSRCQLIRGDVGNEAFCRSAIDDVVQEFGRIDIVVSNAAEQHPQKSIADISEIQLERTFRSNVFGAFFLIKAALPHLKPGASVLLTTSVTHYEGSAALLDYSATKGALVALTRSLSQSLVEKGIRVNAVAPGPIWTPLIPATFDAEKVAKFGQDTPMKRPGQPSEVAPSFVFLASEDTSYMTGQILHPDGGNSTSS